MDYHPPGRPLVWTYWLCCAVVETLTFSCIMTSYSHVGILPGVQRWAKILPESEYALGTLQDLCITTFYPSFSLSPSVFIIVESSDKRLSVGWDEV